MVNERMLEFIIMMMLEDKCIQYSDFKEYISSHYDIAKFNERYMQLLDEFLNKYALDNTEKSD